MGRRKSFCETIGDWPVEQRIDRAKDLTNKLTYRIQDVIQIHAANEIVLYSSELSKQIPKSLATHAFNVFRDSQFKFEIIRLVALWDKPGDNIVSIPTVIALIDDPDVIEKLVTETFQVHVNRKVADLNPHHDPKIEKTVDELIDENQREFAKKQCDKCRAVLGICIQTFQDTREAEKTRSIRNLRDYAAHSFTKSRRDAGSPFAKTKYGEETQLFHKTIKLIEDLYCWVNGTSFDISGDCVDQAKGRAEELWNNCHFDIPKR
ncbi:MAG: hypothetical protein R8G34_16040 [Paracoccaceae bacterium]|nr:hypothetical protein [Paracoccaceae bacterium]